MEKDNVRGMKLGVYKNMKLRIGSLALVLVVLGFLVWQDTVFADNVWGDYHWSRQEAKFTLQLGDNVDSNWDTYLVNSINGWNTSTVITLEQTAGGTRPRRCKITKGRVEVCNAKYGFNGWLGIADLLTEQQESTVVVLGGSLVEVVARAVGFVESLVQPKNPFRGDEDPSGDLLLEREEVDELSIEGIAPEALPFRATDQFGRNPHSVARSLHAAVVDEAHLHPVLDARRYGHGGPSPPPLHAHALAVGAQSIYGLALASAGFRLPSGTVRLPSPMGSPRSTQG